MGGETETAPFYGAKVTYHDISKCDTIPEIVEPENATRIVKPALYAQSVSIGLDVFKGCLVFFMLTENAREVLGIPFNTNVVLQFACNLANSMDMVCYSFAYGYSCYRAYLSDAVPRTAEERALRCVRSAVVIWLGAWINDFVLCWRTSGLPSFNQALKILVGYEVYWSFIRCFPIMLLVMLVCKPVIDAAYSGKSRERRMTAAVALLVVPLLCTQIHVPLDCTRGAAKFIPLVVDCEKKPLALIFPTLPYLFNFNFGVLAAMFIRRWTSPGLPFLSERRPRLTELVGLVVSTAAVSCGFGLLLITYWQADFSMLNYGVFRRFPPNIPWLFGCMSFGILFLVCTTAVGAELESSRDGWGAWPLAFFEHLGANVLVYLTLSNIIFFSVPSPMLPGSGAPMRPPSPWDPFFNAMAAMVIIGIVHYLVKGSRK